MIRNCDYHYDNLDPEDTVPKTTKLLNLAQQTPEPGSPGD